MRFSVLGSLSVERDGPAVTSMSASMTRRLLAALLCKPNECVTFGDLIFALWGDAPPPGARKTLLVYIRRLRSALGEDGRIVHEPSGYRIVIREGELDAAEFSRLVQAASRATAGQAATLLADALALWRGNAFEDVRENPPIAEEASRLDEERIRVEAWHARLQLELGRHAELVPQLTKLTETHPYREELRAQLMLALYRCGRQSEALELFRTTRRMLDEELGVEPGPQLQRVHEAILRAELDPPPASEVAGTRSEPVPGLSEGQPLDDEPITAIVRRWRDVLNGKDSGALTVRQAGLARLPAVPADFTGRDAELAKLNKVGADDQRAPAVVVICGTAGVGKTALALSWGHRARHRFPDGGLYVNLRGYDTSRPLLPGEALLQLLPALGVPVEEIPSNVDVAAGLYRGLLDGLRVLVVLDNARDADQVRPLLAAAPGCVTVITSRDRLSGLVARNGSKRLGLGPLSDREALALLAEIVGRSRVNAEPRAARGLVRACANLPLALRIAAADLADRPSRAIDAYLRQLTSGDQAVAGDPHIGLRSALELSYDTLKPPEARLLRLLGLVPGPNFTAGACAALAGVDPAEAARLLERLAAAHLVQEQSEDRYTFHDLLRAYALGKLGERDGAPAQAAAAQRLFDWYLAGAHEAARFLYPQPPRTPPPRNTPADSALPHPATSQEALAWLDREWNNMAALIVPGPGQPHRSGAWRLAAELSGYFWRRKGTAEWGRVAQAALEAAEIDGDLAGQANALLNIRRMHAKIGRITQIATVQNDPALRLAREIGWRDGEIFALNSVAAARIEIGMLASAAHDLHTARRLLETVGIANCSSTFLYNLARIYHRWGEPALATAYARRAFDHHSAVGARGEQAVGHVILSMIARDRGQSAAAEAHARTGLALAADTDDRHIRAYHLINLAAALYGVACDEEATDCAQEALVLAHELEVPQLAGYALILLGDGDRRADRHTDALWRYVKALQIGRRTGFQAIELFARAGLAQMPQLPPAQRVEHAKAALADAESTGARLFAAQLSNVLAQAHLDSGQTDQAGSMARHALRLSRACAHRPGEVRARDLLETLAQGESQPAAPPRPR